MREDLLAMLDVERPVTPARVGVPRASKPALTGRAGYVGRDRKNPLRVSVTLKERKDIEDRAVAAGLSVASYLRACALGRRVARDPALDHEQILALAKVNADQGRLGGLLKLWLVDRPGKGAPEVEVRRLLDRIRDLQGELAEAAGRL